MSAGRGRSETIQEVIQHKGEKNSPPNLTDIAGTSPDDQGEGCPCIPLGRLSSPHSRSSDQGRYVCSGRRDVGGESGGREWPWWTERCGVGEL